MDTLIENYTPYSLWSVSEKNLIHFSEFVANANYLIHQKKYAPDWEIQDVLEHETELYPHSEFFALKNSDNNYIGAIRATLWDGTFSLPMDREFGIDIQRVIRERGFKPTEIWHVARFAIHNYKNSGIQMNFEERLRIIRILLSSVIKLICKHSDNIMLAECDERFLNINPFIGIVGNEIIGKPLMYLGSPTIPVINTANNLSMFLTEKYPVCHV